MLLMVIGGMYEYIIKHENDESIVRSYPPLMSTEQRSMLIIAVIVIFEERLNCLRSYVSAGSLSSSIELCGFSSTELISNVLDLGIR